MRPHSDERLARGASKGSRPAFEAIYQRYHQELYRFCLTLVGNTQDAEEALQNTMMKALRALPGEQRQIRLRPWLYRIARNESIETLRKRRDSVPIESEPIASGMETAETAEAREHLRRLIADFAELPERQRAALAMRELGGIEFEEIGAAFGTSAAVARQTVYEARLSLRQMEAGREMKCKQVMWELSEADGRVTRRKEIRAHLRACHECRSFQDAITRRRGELGAIAPLPIAASAGVLQAVLGASQAATGGGIAGAGAAAGKVAATSAIAKSAATVAVVAAIGVTAADRGGVLDVPIGDTSGPARESSPPPGPGPARLAIPVAPRVDLGGRREVDPAELRDRVEAAAKGNDVNPDPAAATAGDDAGALPTMAAPGATGAGERSRGEGRAAGLPAASDRGQQTAAAHKSPRGNPSPGVPRPGEKSRGRPSHTGRPPQPPKARGNPTPPGRADADPTQPPAPEKGPPPKADGSPSSAGQP